MKESPIIEEFQEEARLEQGRDGILQVLDAKFGPQAPKEFAEALRGETDLGRLNRVLRLAAQSSGIKQFRDRFAQI